MFWFHYHNNNISLKPQMFFISLGKCGNKRDAQLRARNKSCAFRKIWTRECAKRTFVQEFAVVPGAVFLCARHIW